MFWVTIIANIVLGLPLAAEGRPLDKSSLSQSPIVDLGYAQYEGTTLDIGVNQFLGIRYAAPPLGDLRFRAPEDPVVTNGVQAAKEVFTLPGCHALNYFTFSRHSSSGQPASGQMGPDQH